MKNESEPTTRASTIEPISARSRFHAPRHETTRSRALRVSLARAFPVQIAPMREALASGCVTRLTRP